MAVVQTRNSPRLRRVLLAVSGGAFLLSLVIAISGGVALRLAGVPIRAHKPGLALLIGAAAGLAALPFGGRSRVRADLDAAWRGRARLAPPVVLAAAAACVAVGLAWGTWAASGADAYGYVSQALLWKSGSLVKPAALAAEAPWPLPEVTLAPLGWRPAVELGAIVPTYAPGLPLLMALAAWFAGNSAVFWIVPLTGAMAVWWTWRLGTVLTDRAAAAAAAVLMACGPAFLFQLVQPMSDVPVTAWWTGALLFVITRRPALAGACASAAILTRPNLAPLAGWLAVLVWLDLGLGEPARLSRGGRSRVAAAAWFVVAAAPGVATWLAINRAWYGRLLASRYGSFSGLFALANVAANAERYGRWLMHAHTPFVLLAFTSPVLAWWAVRRGTPADASEGVRGDAGNGGEVRRPATPRVLAAVLAWPALVVLAYLPYASFAEWTYLRFLLPALPVLLVLSCGVAATVLARVPGPAALILLAAGTTALATYQVTEARRGQAFELQRLERRYVDAGRYAASALPPSAVLLAVQHSGSLGLYSGRPTIRWDNLDPAWFDRALSHLRSRGYEPFIVLEAWEEAQFREHLSAVSVIGRLDWPPAVELNLAVKVRFYDPRDRDVFAAGGFVPIRRLGPDELPR